MDRSEKKVPPPLKNDVVRCGRLTTERVLLLLWLEEEEDEVDVCGGGNGKVNPEINWAFAAIILQQKQSTSIDCLKF